MAGFLSAEDGELDLHLKFIGDVGTEDYPRVIFELIENV